MSDARSHHDLLLRASQVPTLQQVLEKLEHGHSCSLTHATKASWPFLAAALTSRLGQGRGVWFLSHDVRSQEKFFQEWNEWQEALCFFPSLGMTAEGIGLPDPEIVSERLAFVGRVAQEKSFVASVTLSALSDNVPSPKELLADVLKITVGWKGAPGKLAKQLEEVGLERTIRVAHRGEYALRGGILDLFAWQEQFPCRLEFDEEKIISIRSFDPDTQLSSENLESCEIQYAEAERAGVALSSYIKKEDLIILLGDDFSEEEEEFAKKLPAAKLQISEIGGDNELTCLPIPFASFAAGDFVMEAGRRKEFFKQLRQWQEQHYQLFFFSTTEAAGERFADLAEKEKLTRSSLQLRSGAISEGFVISEAKIVFLSEAEIFGRSAQQQWRLSHRKREEQRAARSMIDYTEFEEGDFVVHAEYGIGHYAGIQRMPDLYGEMTEVLVLEFAEEAKLFVPLDQAWQVSRYVGVGKAIPSLSSLGNDRWKKTRADAEKSVFLYAGKLLKLQAEREIGSGHAFGPDTPWQRELEEHFPYRETVDQLRAIVEIKQDMESPVPMDRLLCGDVGFGKTEVALRAAFKAVLDGKQVVFLAPTTVLAQQHFQTLKERMSSYPAKVELMSRYRTKAEQSEVAKGLAKGSVDIVVGTHRLLSSDILFKDLGLVIVDEEQRFGVKHKEMFKERFRFVDMLTLSATPIPRTLYLSLMGARKMSLLETPPANRQAIETLIAPYDERLITKAIEQELTRSGQVYFLHNRVATIEKVATRLQELVPKARIAIGHGQMDEKDLEQVMQRFVRGEADILVSTTIIESGLDIPNANTIIIDRADRFGLADLYQLRGRVGRSQQKAYAYLLLPRSMMVFGEARRRVQAIRQYSELGAGFKIAMRDLEIRGAGNLLGTAQSGHIAAVGFDLYCKMLRKAVAQMKGEQQQASSFAQSSLFLDFVAPSAAAWEHACKEHAAKEKVERKKFSQLLLPAFIPEEYLQEVTLRLELYRQLSAAADRQALELLERSWRDRFGPLPEPLQHLLMMELIRRIAAECGITKVETQGSKLMLTRHGSLLQLNHRFPRLLAVTPAAKMKEVLQFVESLQVV
ncbi:MAG: transcription-repair coupling factor [Chthoniobacterales bacterium]|nr:transcription-repair coupling factor [Chthoniobacterales bacterium]